MYEKGSNLMSSRKQLPVTLDDPMVVSELKTLGASRLVTLRKPLAFSVAGKNWYLRKIITYVFDEGPSEVKLRGFGSYDSNSSSNDVQVDMELYLREHKRFGYIHFPS